MSETTFNNKYRHQGAETWSALSRTLVEHVCGDYLSKDQRDQLYRYISDMKFIPGGRYLYYAGREKPYFNNCFRAGTSVLTDGGWRDVSCLGVSRVYSPPHGGFLDAEFKSHGIQKLYNFIFSPLRGNSNITYTVSATRNHKWLLKTGGTTEELRVGDVIPANPHALGNKKSIGFVHGFMFGDGTSNGQLRLCAPKDLAYLDILSEYGTVTYPDFANGDPVLYFSRDYNIKWKELPDTNITSPSYISYFIEGWLAANGSANRLLCSVNKEHLEWFRQYAPFAGLVISGELRHQDRDIKLGKYEYKKHRIYIQNYSTGVSWPGFKCIGIEYLGEEEVYCPFEPVYNQIVIDHGIHTYQCYLLKAEEDTREDWANLAWKAESCLLTGGGIGVDYSVYRPAGSTIRRTGGSASGPIPKMGGINNQGRYIMQGGSRRSAIYASLSCHHSDIEEFLRVKDWDNQPAGTSGLTYGDLKRQDFNFPAPLDMTNISVNYDTKWLLEYYKTGDVGDVFRKNVRMALRNGEPGFSFNFFEKENETLRNACTEVTSSDDSDVCNLGSVNLSRIRDTVELASVVELGTLFLLCGTLVAELPYPKISEVRERNRRLGLGLMGIHEWLIQRGYGYEVVPELHRWLSIYKGVSNHSSAFYSDKLSVSRPVANRSIAPTGTIGILAGTTTGIEPIYAVAYKRRYLTGGTKWKYQYHVDSVAQQMIETYGVSPDSITTASDMANDPERRIKFQADIQDYVDMGISSTINLPAYDAGKVDEGDFARILATYAPRLRGFTCYPDGSRGGQPLVQVDYNEVKDKLGDEFEESTEYNAICDITGGGHCGV